MANRSLISFLLLAAGIGLAIVGLAQSPTPRPSPPTGGIFPITNGKLLSPLDANNFPTINAPTPTGPNDLATKAYVDSHAGGGGGGGGGLNSITGDNGAATGLTLTITGTNVLTDPVFTLGATLNLANGGTGATTAGAARTNLGLGNVDNTSDAAKPVSSPTQTALNLKADTSTVNTALSGKADAAATTTALAGKEGALGNPGTNGDCLVSTTLGVRSWTTCSGGGGGGGGSGTVTSFSAGSFSPLFTTTVDSPGSTPILSFLAVAVPANTFYGNKTSLGANPGFMNASEARTSLGGTTAGQAMFQIANPNAIAFPRFNADNSVTTRTGAQILGDMGGESALTFSAPLSRSVNTISIPAATDTVAGHLTAADHATFNSKIASTRTISTTAPLTGGGDLSANRTIAIPAATDSVNGYLTAVDHAAFASVYFTSLNHVAAPASGTLDIGALNAAHPAGTAQINRIALTLQLTGPLTIILPPAFAYGGNVGYKSIEIVDVIGNAMQNNPITVKPASGDTLDGFDSSTGIVLARGSTYFAFTSNGAGGKWNSTYFYANAVKDPTTPGKQFVFDASLQSASGTPAGRVTAALGQSVTVTPTDGGTTPVGQVTDITSQGVAIKRPSNPNELQPTEYVITTPSGNIASGSVWAAPNASSISTPGAPGAVTTIRIAGTLQGPITINLPTAASYYPSSELSLIDANGSVSSTNLVIVNSIFSPNDTINGASTSYRFDEPNGRRVFTSDGAGNWSIPTTKAEVLPYAIIPNPSGTFTVPGSTHAVKHNGTVTLVNGANIMLVSSPYDGMDIDLFLVQPASGAAGTLNLPQTSRTEAGALGVVTLSATSGTIDRLRCVYNQTLQAFMCDTAKLNYATGGTLLTPTGLSATPGGSSQISLTWTDNASNETGYLVQRANGLSATTGFSTLPAATNLAANSTSFNDTTGFPNSPYTYRVRAFNAGNNSNFSSTASATTTPAAAPAELWELHLDENTGIDAGSIAIGSPNATLSKPLWSTAVPNGAPNVSCFAPTLAMTTTTGVIVTPTGGTGPTTYTYRINAIKGGYHNGYGGGTTTTGVASLSSTTYNVVSWSAVTPTPDYYEVYRTVGGVSQGLLATTGPGFTATTLNDTGLSTSAGGGPYQFSSDASTITAKSNITFATNIVTASFWVKSTFSGAANGPVIFDITGGGVHKISALAGKIECRFNGVTGFIAATIPLSTVSAADGTTISSNNWHLITVVMDNSITNTPSTCLPTSSGTSSDSIRFYLDGDHQITASFTNCNRSGSPTTFPAGAPKIGAAFFGGLIDDPRIYNRALNPTERAALFTDGPQ